MFRRSFHQYRLQPADNDIKEENRMVKTATFEALLEDARPDGDGGYSFTLEGKTYRIRDKDEVRKIAEQHGYIIIY
jgi:hypothetical protein